MKITAGSVADRNLIEMRRVHDAWCDQQPVMNDALREDIWDRVVAAGLTETNFRILAHTGRWGGGGKINAAQQAILATSADLYRAATGREPDGWGSNGGSVGLLQQIPTPVAQAADRPWGGWGSIVDCMVIATSLPKFLDRIRVTDDSTYGGKPMASAIVADLLRVQQPLPSEVDANYGGQVTRDAVAIARSYPRTRSTTQKEWLDMATKDEVAEVFADGVDRRAFYKVVRDQDTGIDYAYAPGVFILITSLDHYIALQDAGFINVGNGQARKVNRRTLGFIRNECARVAAPGVKLDDYR